MIDWILKLFGVVAFCEFKAERERTERWTKRAFAAEDNAAEAGRELHRVINQSASLHAYYSDQKRRNADLKTERNALRDSLANATEEHRDSLLREGAVEMEVAALQQSLDCQKEILAKNAVKHQQVCDVNNVTRAALAGSHDSMLIQCQKAKMAHGITEDELAECQEELEATKLSLAYEKERLGHINNEHPIASSEIWRLVKEKDSLEKANKGLRKALLSVKDELSALKKDIGDEVPRGTVREKRTNGDISYLRAKLASRDKEIENLKIRVKHNAAAYHTSCMELRGVRRNYRALRDERDNKKNALGEISEISTRNI